MTDSEKRKLIRNVKAEVRGAFFAGGVRMRISSTTCGTLSIRATH
jgi:hypothetical protein